MKKAREYVELYKETLQKEDGFEVLAQQATIKGFMADIGHEWATRKHNQDVAIRILTEADEIWRELAKLLSWVEPEKFAKMVRTVYPEAYVVWQMYLEENK